MLLLYQVQFKGLHGKVLAVLRACERRGRGEGGREERKGEGGRGREREGGVREERVEWKGRRREGWKNKGGKGREKEGGEGGGKR